MDFFQRILENPESLFNPEELLQIGGLVLLCLMIFAETGIFFCFFFPGDSLVFTAGVLTATGALHQHIYVVILSMSVAASLGNLTGYMFGRSVGKLIYQRKESWFFKTEYLILADKFYKKYGGLALMAGRFFPVIRTFAPIIAGVIRVDFYKFFFYTVAGAITWTVPLAAAGHWLGRIPFVQEYLEFIIIGFIVVITTPVVLRLMKESKKRKEIARQ